MNQDDVIVISDDETPTSGQVMTACERKKTGKEVMKSQGAVRKRRTARSSSASEESSDNSQASTVVNWKVSEKRPQKARQSIMSGREYLKAKKRELKENLEETTHMLTEVFLQRLVTRLEGLRCKIAEQQEIIKTLRKNNNKMKRDVMDFQLEGCDENCSSSDESLSLF
ncbi:uncharacterized protein LOC106665931 [Cimex lectularius]|uniref:Uncharacterized protein n=1 Tax=Cimex lectularius TaxID=79782 RepID=A0A8I6RL25_CIMLE|nr:uncharacterized protein LOC106665931 [Cimex lectularius]